MTTDDRREQNVQALVRQASAPPDLSSQPGRVGLRTKITAAVTTLLGGAAVVGVVPELLGVLAVMTGIGALIALARDLSIPSPRGRRTPRQAATCFAKALRRGQFRKAYACCHPETLSERVNVPEIERLRIEGEEMSWQRFQVFEKFWKAILRGKGSTIRHCARVVIDEPTVEGHRAFTRVTFKMTRYSTWVYLGMFGGILPTVVLYLLNRKSGDVEARIELFHHRSQWWVLPCSPYDASGPHQLAPAKARYLPSEP